MFSARANPMQSETWLDFKFFDVVLGRFEAERWKIVLEKLKNKSWISWSKSISIDESTAFQLEFIKFNNFQNQKLAPQKKSCLAEYNNITNDIFKATQDIKIVKYHANKLILNCVVVGFVKLQTQQIIQIVFMCLNILVLVCWIHNMNNNKKLRNN